MGDNELSKMNSMNETNRSMNSFLILFSFWGTEAGERREFQETLKGPQEP